MKRTRIYKPRRGIRFDNKHVHGPDGSYLGSDIQVITLTGSVMTSVTQRDGAYEINTSAPVVGYARSNLQMTAIVGSGKLPTDSNVAGFGFDAESITPFVDDTWIVDPFYIGDTTTYGSSWTGTGSIASSSLDNTSLGPRGYLDSLKRLGLNTPTVDKALRFMHSGSRATSSPANHTVHSGSHGIGLIFVLKFDDSTVNSDVFSKGLGTDVNYQGVASTCGYALTLETGSIAFSIGDNGGNFAKSYVPLDANTWYITLARYSKAGSIRVSAIPFWGGSAVHGAIVDGTAVTGTFGSSAARPNIGANEYHRFGVKSSLAYAAGYISAGTQNFTMDLSDEGQASILTQLQDAFTARDSVVTEGNTLIDDSIGPFGTADETQYLNQQLLGLSTGALGRALGTITAVTGTIPSWTNSHIRNSAFVLTALSSSDHETQVLNNFRSGSEYIESSVVPASRTTYYSKKSKLNRITVKKTASLEMVTPPTDANLPMRPYRLTPVSGALLIASTGSVNGAGLTGEGDASSACSVAFEVPQRGKLVDISVWVELHHQSGTTMEAGISADGICTPLGSLALGIRSPNVRFGNGLPFMSADGNPATAGYGVATDFGEHTFVLWSSLGFESYDYSTYDTSDSSSVAYPDLTITPLSDVRQKYGTWERDHDMRTIFNDGARIPNPRHNYYTSYVDASGNFVGAPNAALGFNNAWGFGISWTGSIGSPPAGWLSGPGGTNAENEWPTTGSNRGADKIRPIYPMLDPITISFAPAGPGVLYPTTSENRPFDMTAKTWTRPGLRGTEISGTWYLMIANGAYESSINARRTTAYLRQARLELVYEEHEGGSDARRDVSNVTPARQGRRMITSVSSSYQGIDAVPTTASMDVYVTDKTDAEVGRTFGIVLNTGSIDHSSYALIYRLTGTLADMSGSAPGWLTNNGFGMPQIPISSASLVPYVEQAVVTSHPQNILTSRPTLDGARRLADAARDASPAQTLIQQFDVALSGTAT